MFKNILKLAVVALVLTGCSSANQYSSEQIRESLLKSTDNNAELITFYKHKVEEDDSTINLENLAEAYLNYGDPESALHTLENISKDAVTPKSLYLTSKSYFELENSDQAIIYAEKAYFKSEQNAAISNYLGVVYASEGNFITAKHYFELSKRGNGSRVEAQNNLAVLEMIGGDYHKAVDLLSPIYHSEPDEKVKTNLLIALSKNGEFEKVKSILSSEYSSSDVKKMYKTMQELEMKFQQG